MKDLKNILSKSIQISKDVEISVQNILILLFVLLFATLFLRLLRRLISRKLPSDDKLKFKAVFSYATWFSYVVIVLVTLHTVGVNVTGIFAASAALLIGIGLALQTLFQDIISGVFILIDQSVHVGDIIELDGKIGRVEEIKLRTTRAVTIDNKVLVIPNKKLLIEAAKGHKDVLEYPGPAVLFTDFGDSSLNFRIAFTLNDSFNARIPKSDIRFEIDRLFRENNISIPFPQRDIHIIQK